MVDRFFGDAFGSFSCQFWSFVLQSGARLPIHTLNYWTEQSVVPGFYLGGGVFECDVSHCRSVAVLCMLYKIRCNPVDPLNGALHGPYVPVLVTRGALVAHRYTYAPPRCRTCITAELLFPSRCPSGTILLTPCSMEWDLRVSRAGPMLLYWPELLYPYYSLLLFFPFSFFCLSVGIVGLGCGTCHMAYILTFYIFLPSLNYNIICIFSSYFIKHTLASFFKFLSICATKSMHLGI